MLLNMTCARSERPHDNLTESHNDLTAISQQSHGNLTTISQQPHLFINEDVVVPLH
jgi:hypothetical protein